MILKYEDMTDEQKALDKAHDIVNEITNCMSDLAEGDEIEADRMFDDENVMSDMFNDRCFELCGFLKTEDDKIFCLMVCDEVIELAHRALIVAVNEFLDRKIW